MNAGLSRVFYDVRDTGSNLKGYLSVKKLSIFAYLGFVVSFTPFAVHYEKIRIHLRETATNSAKIHSLARKSEHLLINQIQ